MKVLIIYFPECEEDNQCKDPNRPYCRVDNVYHGVHNADYSCVGKMTITYTEYMNGLNRILDW